jgi:hypothetical protein
MEIESLSGIESTRGPLNVKTRVTQAGDLREPDAMARR